MTDIDPASFTHPDWCDLTECTVAARDTIGQHRSRPFSVHDTLTADLPLAEFSVAVRLVQNGWEPLTDDTLQVELEFTRAPFTSVEGYALEVPALWVLLDHIHRALSLSAGPQVVAVVPRDLGNGAAAEVHVSRWQSSGTDPRTFVELKWFDEDGRAYCDHDLSPTQARRLAAELLEMAGPDDSGEVSS